MAISLYTPIGSSFIKDFPVQNAVNCDRIDNYAGPSQITHSMTSYSPVIDAFIAPTIGTGGVATNRGFYYRIFDQMYVWGEFRFGTTGMNVGGGVWRLSLPFPVNTTLGPNNTPGITPVVGTATVWANSSANRQALTVNLYSNTDIFFTLRTNSGAANREVTHNSPIAWAAGEGISWQVKYQRVTP